MIIVTHEMGFALEVGDRIVFMEYGTIARIAPPTEFFSNPTEPRLISFLSKVL
jgi:ABC-type polar amino acid transport system ATPase subunit